MPTLQIGWHIGDLSEAESIAAVAGTAAIVAAAIAIPLALVSPSGP
jgi:hypothetical protein